MTLVLWTTLPQSTPVRRLEPATSRGPKAVANQVLENARTKPARQGLFPAALFPDCRRPRDCGEAVVHSGHSARRGRSTVQLSTAATVLQLPHASLRHSKWGSPCPAVLTLGQQSSGARLRVAGISIPFHRTPRTIPHAAALRAQTTERARPSLARSRKMRAQGH